MHIITAADIAAQSLSALFGDAVRFLEADLARWQEFKKSPRHAVHYDHGVFELMPCADAQHYTYKYVNAHPENPRLGKLSIVALGMLADVATGYPQLVCDMTLLTAIRTAAMSALAIRHFAAENASTLAIIGTGAQSEFQVHAARSVRNIKIIRYFDRDAAAMQKFARNLQGSGLELVACTSGDEAVHGADIITTCICEKAKVQLFSAASIDTNKPVFINAIGGDCPGKTELDPALLHRARIIVEFFEQTKYEGEIQNLDGEFACDEIWEIVQSKKPGRTAGEGLIIFDSVGFGLADFSMMRMLHERGIGETLDLLPAPHEPKDLIGLFARA